MNSLNKRLAQTNSSPLIDAGELQSILGSARLKLFDVRGTWSAPARALPEEYFAGHIPGAVFLDWTHQFIEADTPLELANVANEAGAERAFRSLGINNGDVVVLYDNASHMLAGRIWWAMRYWGFPNVYVLDGGWQSWLGQQFPVTTASTDPAHAGTFKPRKQEGLRVSLGEFVRQQPRSCVIDGRGSQSFAGNAKDPRSGHIPGSMNVPFNAFLDEQTGQFLDKMRIARLLDQKSPIWRTAPIITTCGAGYAATVVMLALGKLEHASSLFDGSFGEWKQDSSRRVEQTLA